MLASWRWRRGGGDGAVPNPGFGKAEAVESPGVVNEAIDEGRLDEVGGVPGVAEGSGEGFELFGALAGDDHLGGMPVFRALKRTACFTSGVTGPFDFCAFS
jgi:hypothetical protein